MGNWDLSNDSLYIFHGSFWHTQYNKIVAVIISPRNNSVLLCESSFVLVVLSVSFSKNDNKNHVFKISLRL